MPEFHMDGKDSAEFAALDPFTRGYIECMFFTTCEIGTTRETHDPETQSELPGDCGFDDLSPGALEVIKSDCAVFQRKAFIQLHHAQEREGYSLERAGHDFWLTRNGHGAGFWDRKELKFKVSEYDTQRVSDTLSDVAKWFGEVNPGLGDDDLVYL